MLFYTEQDKKKLTLRQKQSLFVRMIADLIMFSYKNGYELTFGEALRLQSTANDNAKSGAGISNSNHLIKLAIDFNLFKDGKWLQDSESHQPLGEFWESMGGSWGGRFKDKNGKPKPDGNHYSLEHNGVK